MPELLHRLRQSLQATRLLLPGQRVLAAVSGGPDSVALAHLLHRLGFLAGIAHCDHGLRPESADEAALVRAHAEAWGLPFHLLCIDPATLRLPGDSVQARARAARYAFLESLLESQPYDRCATAHHADDQAETVLLQLLRGNDPRALMPIPARRGVFVRPLLDVGKADLLAYCTANGLAYATDPSNDDLHYLRNAIRHVALPALTALNPNIDERLRTLGQDAALAAAWEDRWWPALAELVLKAGPGDVWLDAAALSDIPWAPPLELVLAAWMRRIGWHGNALRQAMRLPQAYVGAQVLAEGSVLTRTHAGYTWTQAQADTGFAELSVAEGPAQGRVGDWAFALTRQDTWQFPQAVEEQGYVFYMDVRAVFFPLTLRPWRLGDKMRPFGKGGLKKLSDIFIDRHWSAQDKRRALVVASSGGEVLALSRFRISDSVRVCPDTTAVWCLRLTELAPRLSPPGEDVLDSPDDF